MDMSGIVGQKEAKNLLTQAQRRRMNILLVGPPGTGKTMLALRYLQTFSNPVAEMMGKGVLTLNGSEKTREIRKKLDAMPGRPVLIDEAHKLRSAEMIYEYLKPQRGILSMFRPSSVFAFATTDEGGLPDALISRLVKVALKPYTQVELAAIAMMEHEHPTDVLMEIARLSHGSPRRAKILSELLSTAAPSSELEVRNVLRSLGYPQGLDYREATMLNLLVDGPAGIGTIASLMSAGTKTIRVIESDLIASGLLVITNRGRVLTDKGREIANNLMLM